MSKIRVIFGRKKKNHAQSTVFKRLSLICDSDDACGAQHILLQQESQVCRLGTTHTWAEGFCWLREEPAAPCRHISCVPKPAAPCQGVCWGQSCSLAAGGKHGDVSGHKVMGWRVSFRRFPDLCWTPGQAPTSLLPPGAGQGWSPPCPQR